jgi:hypothetical protein
MEPLKMAYSCRLTGDGAHRRSNPASTNIVNKVGRKKYLLGCSHI